MDHIVSICFVCLGNICRSPTAEAVMADLVQKAGYENLIFIDSAGTGDWHVGKPPDSRAQDEMKNRGLSPRSNARRFHPGDFTLFDLIICMDTRNEADLSDIASSPSEREKIRLLKTFDPTCSQESKPVVRDPYHDGPEGFTVMFDEISEACKGLLTFLENNYLVS